MNKPAEIEWMKHLADATEELATTMLGMVECPIIEEKVILDQDVLSQSFVALVGDDTMVNLGITVKENDAQGVAKALFAMEPEDEDLPPEDVVDALGEIINIVAGSVKTRVHDSLPALKLGLPMVTKGTILPGSKSQSNAIKVRLGAQDLILVVVKSG